jgi:Skp family chaperone for outer membrane proteins
MTLKTDTHGNYTLVDDGNSNLTVSNVISTKATLGTYNNWNSVATTSSISSVIEEITKKPEVRPEQRSSLEITEKVVAKFYKDGFFTDSKYLIPAIAGVDVFNENTVKVTFVNGNVQTATVQKCDTFSLEDGLIRCIVKEMIGKEGTAILGKLLSYATDVYNKAEADKKKKAEEEEKKRITAEKNRKKLQKHWEKKRAMEREKRIQEMSEAIVRAKEMEKNV